MSVSGLVSVVILPSQPGISQCNKCDHTFNWSWEKPGKGRGERDGAMKVRAEEFGWVRIHLQVGVSQKWRKV